jgi:hypothetical protein
MAQLLNSSSPKDPARLQVTAQHSLTGKKPKSRLPRLGRVERSRLTSCLGSRREHHHHVGIFPILGRMTTCLAMGRKMWQSFLRSLLMKSYSLSDISPRIRNRRDDVALVPCYRLCYVTEQYVPKIGYLQKRVRTLRYVLLQTTQSGC